MTVKVLLVLVALTCVAYFFHPVHPDEGVFATISQGVMQGRLVYRDLFDHKPPGVHMLLAFVFYLFGDSVLSLRSIVIFTNLISAYLVYFLLRTVGERLALLGSLLFLLILPLVHGTYALTEVFAVPWVLLSVIFIVRHREEKWYAVGTGVCIGIAVLFKLTFIVTGIVAVLYHLSGPGKVRASFIRAWDVLLGLAMPIGLIGLAMFYLQVFGEFYEQVIQFVIYNYPSQINFTSLVFMGFLSFSLIGFLYVALRGVHKKAVPNSVSIVLYLYILSFIPSLIYRPYHHYWIPIIPFIVIFSVQGVKAVKWGEIILLSNAIILSVIYLVHTVVVSYPTLSYQITTAENSGNCKEVSSPIQYFLTKCPPEDKHFYPVY